VISTEPCALDGLLLGDVSVGGRGVVVRGGVVAGGVVAKVVEGRCVGGRVIPGRVLCKDSRTITTVAIVTKATSIHTKAIYRFFAIKSQLSGKYILFLVISMCKKIKKVPRAFPRHPQKPN
jgi:hypothetical protein